MTRAMIYMRKLLCWYSEGINLECFYFRKKIKKEKLKGGLEKTISNMAGLW